MSIAYDTSTRTYTVPTGTPTSAIQQVIDTAAPGSILYFAAGTHTITKSLLIDRDDISLEGAGKGKTTLLFDMDTPDYGINVTGAYTSWTGGISADAAKGVYTITLKSATGLKAGDILHIQQQNTDEFLLANGYENLVGTDNGYKNPMHESVVEIASISGNTVTLKTPITHAMESDYTTIKVIDPIKGVSLKGFTVTYPFGTPDPDSFTDAVPEYSGKIAIYMQKTYGAKITDVGVLNAPSHSLEFRTGLHPDVDGFSAIGAHNKGATGNGYGLQLAETYYGTFDNLVLMDVRHAVAFASWHAEVGNKIHVLQTNRDINYHGGPDYNNYVVVEHDVYREGDTTWRLVSPGGSKHPYTDISANTTLFGVASGGSKYDVVQGWDKGAWLSGNGGKDTLTGGAGNDVLIGGVEYDTLKGGAGSDKFVFRPSDGRDTIMDFKAGTGGDYMVLQGFGSGIDFSDVKMTDYGSYTRISIGTDVLADLMGVKPSALVSANFLFNQTGIETPPPPPTQPTPAPEPEPTPVPEPEPTPTPVTGTTSKLSSGTDTVTGTDGNDLVSTYSGQFDAEDKISLGKGYDTIKIESSSFSFDGRLFKNISGLDMLDLTAATKAVKVVLDAAFLKATDNKVLDIAYKSPGSATLDLSAIDQSLYDVKVADNGQKLTVTLTDKTAPTPTPTPTPEPEPEPTPTPVTGTTAKLSSGTDTVTGTDGNDLVSTYSGQFDVEDKISLGKGYDTIKVESSSFSFDGRLFKNISGLDMLDLTAATRAVKVVLDAAFLKATDNKVLDIAYKSPGSATLDLSAIDPSLYDVKVADNGQKLTVTLTDKAAPTPVPEPTPEPTPTPVAGEEYSLTSSSNTVTGTAGDDIVTGYSSQINTGDTVSLGAGYDTLAFRSKSFTFDSIGFTGFSGVDHLDVSAANGTAKIILDDRFVNASDAHKLTISYGTSGFAMLDTSRVSKALNDVFVKGSGTVTLSENADEVRVAKGSTGYILGQGGDDQLYGDDGIDSLFGGAGNDLLQGGKGADRLSGGAGADVFRYTSMLEAGDVISDFDASDDLDLSALFDANGLGSLSAADAVSKGYVSFAQQGTDTVVSFDSDGAAGSKAKAVLVTLEGTDIDTILPVSQLVA